MKLPLIVMDISFFVATAAGARERSIYQANCWHAPVGGQAQEPKPWETQLQHFAGTTSPELRGHHNVVFSKAT